MEPRKELENATLQGEADQSIANELRAAISGGIVLPSDKSYEAARQVWNGAVTHRPAIIALCQNTTDVCAAVRIARRHELPISVRGGGHNCAGLALRHNGLVLDLTRMRQVDVDPHARIATAAGGSRVKDVATAADGHDLVAVLGNCGMVGMAGLMLGGGYGPLVGTHGLAADNLLGADVVLADGQCVTTDAHNEPELFWALRGGGGNFGAVTSMRIQLHEMNHLLAGSIFYPWNEAASALSRYVDFSAAAPEELGTLIGMVSAPDGQPALLLTTLWNGDEHRGNQIIGQIQTLGKPLQAGIGPSTYTDMLAPNDAMVDQAAGCHWDVRTRWLPALTSAAIQALMEAIERKTSPHSMILMHQFHGAATRVATEAAAFGFRSGHYMVEIIAAWEPDGDNGSKHRHWTQEVWQSIAPFSAPGGYANLLRPEDSEQTAHAYGGNGARLSALKRRFDPDDVFSSAIPLPQQGDLQLDRMRRPEHR